MKWMLLATLTGWMLAASTQKAFSQYHVVQRITTDLNNDGKTDTITLASSENDERFNRITIALAGFKKQRFYKKENWAAVDKNFLAENKNDVKSNLIFLKKTQKQAVILLFGELDGGGYRDEFAIINIENNSIKEVFNASEKKEVEWPVTLTNLSGADHLCFIYRDTFQFAGCSSELQYQKGKPDIGSYAPFYVYPVDDSCKMSKQLTKEYNQDHYVFAGFKYNEHILVFYPPKGGKYKIWHKKVIQ